VNPFDFLNSINDNKQDLFTDPQAEKDYNAFMVNRGLSYFPDTILYANEMNRNFDMPKEWQFQFLRISIPKKKRFSKWHKKDSVTDLLKLIMKHYKYSEKRAYEVINILSPTQIEEIRASYETGGRS
jgi:hypothetical protein